MRRTPQSHTPSILSLPPSSNNRQDEKEEKEEALLAPPPLPFSPLA